MAKDQAAAHTGRELIASELSGRGHRHLATNTPLHISPVNMSAILAKSFGPNWHLRFAYTSRGKPTPLRHLYLFHLWNQCNLEVMNYEEEFKWQFDWYICARTDLLWLEHHPPASLLEARHLYTFDNHDSRVVSV